MSQAEAEAALSAMGLSAAEGAATASTLSLKGAFQGLMATLKPFAPLLIGAAAAFATFKAIQYFSFDGFYKRATKDREALEETQKSISETTASIEENNNKIQELKNQQASGNYSKSLDNEISKLERENVILEQQKKLYEEKLKLEQQQAVKSAGKALTQTDLYDTTVFNPETGVYESKREKRTILENIRSDIEKSKELQKALDDNAESIVSVKSHNI